LTKNSKEVGFPRKVASGIPVRNGKQHAEEVCRLALKLIRAGSAISVPSWGVVTICPRIGINSGIEVFDISVIISA
jgi:hypothetical protein